MDTRAKIHKLVNEHVRANMPDEIKRLAAYANADLHFGPDHNGLDPDAPFPGFSSACETIAAWNSDNLPRELWIDLGCDYVATSAPEAYEENEDGEMIEADTSEIYGIERRDILRAVFGELGEYVR